MDAMIYSDRESGTGRPRELGRISYTDESGQPCIVLAQRYTDEPSAWVAKWVTGIGLGGLWKHEARKVESGEFPLPQEMLDALAASQTS